MKPIIISLILICTGQAFAQQHETEAYFAALRHHQPAGTLALHKGKENQYIKWLTVYLKDTVPLIRVEAYSLLGLLGQQSPKKNIRKDMVRLLLQGCRDTDGCTYAQAERALTKFVADDFDHAARNTVKMLLDSLPRSPGNLFRLIGYLDLRDLAPRITAYVENHQPPLGSRDRWAGYLALARMGDQQALDIVLNRVRSFGIHDEVVQGVFPDLVYTRAYRAIHYLEEVLFSDQKNCTAPNPDAPTGIACAYRVMELLAPIIADYPITLDATGELATPDYTKALEQVRAWFKEKNGTYEILHNTY